MTSEQIDAAAKAAEQTYVVQMCDGQTDSALGVDTDSPPTRKTWVDIATITVPSKTQRRKVRAMALTQAEIKPDPERAPLELRVLDAPSAEVTEVPVIMAEPQFDL